MASQATKRRSKSRNNSKASSRSNGSNRKRKTQRSRSTKSKQTNGSDPRPASQKTEKYRFAKNVEGLGTAAEREYQHYAETDPWELDDDLPDVLLDVPVLKVDSLHFELDNLDAHVALNAYVLDLVKLKVGVDVHLGRVALDIKGVEAQALVKVRLDHVAAVVDRVMTTLDRNPELLESIGAAVEDVGAGGGDMLGESGEAVEDVGEGAEQALEHIGQGAGEGVGEVGRGAGKAVSGVGEGAGQAVGDIGEGTGEAVGDVGEGAGEAVGNLDQTVQGVGQTVGSAGEGVGEAVGGVGQGVGEAAGGLGQGVGGAEALAGALAGGNGQGSVGELADGAGELDVSAGDIAKLVTKLAAQELRSAAAKEAKGLGVAAVRKAKEVREHSRERKAERVNATPAAVAAAKEFDVKIEEVDGTGAEGRITVADVRKAGQEQ
jgi:pyruvate/2-oxoglutarate dehydrogenase complex dihydrolipoamide acyltransferase (E2) component